MKSDSSSGSPRRHASSSLSGSSTGLKSSCPSPSNGSLDAKSHVRESGIQGSSHARMQDFRSFWLPNTTVKLGVQAGRKRAKISNAELPVTEHWTLSMAILPAIAAQLRRTH